MTKGFVNGGRKFVAVGAAIALLGASAGNANGGESAVKRAACNDAGAAAVNVSPKKLNKAILCLVNQERTKRGLKALRSNKKLAKAAKKHTKQMVKTNCLDHQCGGEPNLQGRIRGYLSGARQYAYGEDVGCATTAAKMVSRWMGSPLHRANILNKKFKDAGVGSSQGRVSSRCSKNYATFTIVFGFRKG